MHSSSEVLPEKPQMSAPTSGIPKRLKLSIPVDTWAGMLSNMLGVLGSAPPPKCGMGWCWGSVHAAGKDRAVRPCHPPGME